MTSNGTYETAQQSLAESKEEDGERRGISPARSSYDKPLPVPPLNEETDSETQAPNKRWSAAALPNIPSFTVTPDEKEDPELPKLPFEKEEPELPERPTKEESELPELPKLPIEKEQPELPERLAKAEHELPELPLPELQTTRTPSPRSEERRVGKECSSQV